jgi:hypothetical protein
VHRCAKRSLDGHELDERAQGSGRLDVLVEMLDTPCELRPVQTPRRGMECAPVRWQATPAGNPTAYPQPALCSLVRASTWLRDFVASRLRSTLDLGLRLNMSAILYSRYTFTPAGPTALLPSDPTSMRRHQRSCIEDPKIRRFSSTVQRRHHQHVEPKFWGTGVPLTRASPPLSPLLPSPLRLL